MSKRRTPLQNAVKAKLETSQQKSGMEKLLPPKKEELVPIFGTIPADKAGYGDIIRLEGDEWRIFEKGPAGFLCFNLALKDKTIPISPELLIYPFEDSVTAAKLAVNS